MQLADIETKNVREYELKHILEYDTLNIYN